MKMAADYWRSGKLNQRMRHLQMSQHLTDCTFILGPDNDTQEFKAHKLVLSSCSAVFEAMFYGPLAETSRIRVPDVTVETFEIMLDHVYGNNETDREIKFENVQIAIETCYAANKYDINSLLLACTLYITDYMKFEDLFQVLYFAEMTNNLKLKEASVDIIVLDTDELLNSVTWLEAEEQFIMLVLEQECLNIESELTLIDACLRWAHQKQSANEGMDLRTLMHPFWTHLRLMSLTATEFTTLSKLENFPLTAAEKFAVISCIVEGNNAQLPEGFCQLSSPRFNTVGKNVMHEGFLVLKNVFKRGVSFHYNELNPKCVSNQSLSFLMNENKKLRVFDLKFHHFSTVKKKFSLELRCGNKCLLRYLNTSDTEINDENKITIVCNIPCLLKKGNIYSFQLTFASEITCPQLSHKKETYNSPILTVKDELDSSLCYITRLRFTK